MVTTIVAFDEEGQGIMAGTERYRDFDIDEGYPGTFQYVHKDYDGPEDSRAGWAFTVAECKAEIDEWHEDNTAEAEKLPLHTRGRVIGCAVVLSWIVLALIVYAFLNSAEAREHGYKACVSEAGNTWADCPRSP